MTHRAVISNQSHSTEVTNLILLFTEVTSAISFYRSNLGKHLVDARSNLIDMHLIQSLKIEYCFDMFSKYQAISTNSYFYKLTLLNRTGPKSFPKLGLFSPNIFMHKFRVILLSDQMLNYTTWPCPDNSEKIYPSFKT